MRPPDVLAAVDIGSNTAHLLVAMVDERTVTPLADESAQLGLGAIVDREGRLPYAARQALLDALIGFAAAAQRWQARELLLLGAEPFRRAVDATEVAAAVLGRIGVPVVTLEHAEEAELTLLGVTRGEPPLRPLLVVDIGGGSTEAVLQAPHERPLTFVVPSGSNRLDQACRPTGAQGPIDRECLAVRAGALLAETPGQTADRAVFTGGSATNLARVVTGMRGGDPASPEGIIDRAGIEAAIARLREVGPEAVSARYRVTLGRARLLPAGAALVAAFMDRYALDTIEVSGASLREGAVLAMRQAGSAWRDRLTELTAGWPG